MACLLDQSGFEIGRNFLRSTGSLKYLRPCGRVRVVLRVIRLLDIIPTFEDETKRWPASSASLRKVPMRSPVMNVHRCLTGAVGDVEFESWWR